MNGNDSAQPSIKVPVMEATLTEVLKNESILTEIANRCRDAQTTLSPIPTFGIESALTPNISAAELALFKRFEEMNREIITNMLKMRRLVTAAKIESLRCSTKR